MESGNIFHGILPGISQPILRLLSSAEAIPTGFHEIAEKSLFFYNMELISVKKKGILYEIKVKVSVTAGI